VSRGRQAILLLHNHEPPPGLAGTLPFPLLPVMGRPLADHVLELLAGGGVRRVLALAGDMAHELRSHLGDGTRFGLELTLEAQSGRPGVFESLDRLRSRLDESFWLVPCPALWEGVPDLPDEAGPAWLQAPDGTVPCLFLRRDALGPDLPAGVRSGADAARALHGAALPVAAAWEARDLAGWWRLHRDALAGRLPSLVLTGRELSPGVRVGAACVVHPDAALQPPVVVAAGCSVGAGARVGPEAVLGEGCILEAGAEVREAAVLPGSYVGRGVTVESALVAGPLLVRLPGGEVLHSPDPFLLGEARAAGARRGLPPLLGRLLAGAALLPALPILLGMILAHAFRPGAGLLTRIEVAGQEAVADLSGLRAPRPVRIWRFASRRELWRRLPALLDVAAGRLALVGVEPLPLAEAAALAEPWERLRFLAPPGLVQPWHGLPPGEWEPEEKRVMEGYYARTRTLAGDVGILGRWLGRLL